ncbi:MAG: choice-of-anchor B family protein [Bacteroidia bacterium]|jgi:choice-of-anchor B domain-containing protein|nr:choice-of-anchor B family protein [Bacteroidia bacterium]
MNKYLIFLLTLLVNSQLNAQGRLNMQLLAHYQHDSAFGEFYWNDIMGWYDSTNNKEYMIAGTRDSIFFFDISSPSTIKKVAAFWGQNTGCINRDYYPYQHYMYTTSDQCEGSGKLQIFDMQYLPDSVLLVHSSDSLGALTHTIFIEPQSKRLYMALNKVPDSVTKQLTTFAMDILSIEDPINPKRIGRLVYPPPYNGTRIHEAYVRNDTAYCSSETTGLFIWDLRDAANPNLISAITPPYPQNAYNHSCWLDSSGRYLLFCDETPEGVGMKIYDLDDITEPRIVGSPFKEEGSPHNAYWKGNYAYASMYYGGVQVYDLSTVNQPKLAGYYDTYPKPWQGGFRGCWGVWPFLPSGNILASDMANGLFILRFNESVSLNSEPQLIKPTLYPNPTENYLWLRWHNSWNATCNLAIYDLRGKLVTELGNIVLNNGSNLMANTEHLPPGLYVLYITNEEFHYQLKFATY